MPKTDNLGLEITTDNTELFEVWREFINGNSNNSMAKIIDTFAGGVISQINNLWGASGDITILVADWVGGNAEKTFANLGVADAIIFYPATLNDKLNSEMANLFVTANNDKITFNAEVVPTANITFNYFITRGKVNE